MLYVQLESLFKPTRSNTGIEADVLRQGRFSEQNPLKDYLYLENNLKGISQICYKKSG
jgi:hypothetical protein